MALSQFSTARQLRVVLPEKGSYISENDWTSTHSVQAMSQSHAKILDCNRCETILPTHGFGLAQSAVQGTAEALFLWMDDQNLPGSCVPNAAACIALAAEASQVWTQILNPVK